MTGMAGISAAAMAENVPTPVVPVAWSTWVVFVSDAVSSITVSLALGKVWVVESVPAKVKMFEAVRVLPSAMVNVLPDVGWVIVTLLMVYAVATPREGVVSDAIEIAVPL